MSPRSTSVDAYLNNVPEARQATLEVLRELCRKSLVGYDEGISYRMPSYTRSGQYAVAFASQKNDLSIYIDPKVVEAHRE